MFLHPKGEDKTLSKEMVAKLTKLIGKQRWEDLHLWWVEVKKTDYDHLQEFYDKEELGTEATERCSKGKLN